MTTDYSDVLSQAQASRYLGVNEGTLRGWRREGFGPKYYRAGTKLVRYRRVDLDQWINDRLTEPTAQAAK
jgi:predicted DNA-binding transcriptional regulator AlpA